MLVNALYIYRHIFAQHKARVGGILLMSLLSQVSLLVSLILPWQILYVLSTGHSRMDSMLSSPMPAMLQLIWLSIIIALSFGLYVWLKHQNQVGIAKLADTVVSSLDKTKLMVNHQSIAHFTMGIIVRSLAAIVNWGIFTAIVLVLYPKLAIAILIYMLLLALSIGYSTYHAQNLVDYQKLQDRLQQNSLLLTNLGIAVGFAIIVYDYTQQSLPALVVTFIAVIVIRQALIAYINIALGLLGIKKRIKNINLLFLSKEQQLGLTSQNDFEQQFHQHNLSEWLPEWLASRYPIIKARHPMMAASDGKSASAVSSPAIEIETDMELKDKPQGTNYTNKLSIQCVECKLFSKATIAYVVVQIIEEPSLNESPRPSYLLLKCYHPTKESFAQHEIDFLTVFGTPRQANNSVDILNSVDTLTLSTLNPTGNYENSTNAALPARDPSKSMVSLAGFFGKGHGDITADSSSNNEHYLLEVSDKKASNKRTSNKRAGKTHDTATVGLEIEVEQLLEKGDKNKNEDKSKATAISIMPTLIASGKLAQGSYLLMDFHPDAVGQTLDKRRQYYAQIREHIYNLPVPNTLIERFQRTHVDLAQRMQTVDWSQLDYLHQDERDELRLDEMIKKWAELIIRVQELPKTLTLDNLSTLRLAVCEGRPIVYCWQGWVFDSLGAYWQVSANMDKEIKAVIESMRGQGHISLQNYIDRYSEEALLGNVQLAARLHRFCRNLQQKHNIDALNALKNIFKAIENYE